MNKDLTLRIKQLLLNIGIDPSISGYRMLETSIRFCYNDESYLKAITKRLYPDVAKKHESTESRVERSMRHSIEKAYNLNENIYEKLPLPVEKNKCKFTNSTFIAACVELLKMEDLTEAESA